MGNAGRSARAEVRNPLLKLPSAADVQALPAEAKTALRKLAMEAASAWRSYSDECWRKNKPQPAAYWRSQSINARHLARLCR